MALIQSLGRTLRFVGAYFVANLQAAMEYRVAFWVQIFVMLGSDSLWLFFWWSYFQKFPLVNGWQQTDIVVIWAVSALGFGLGMAIFGNAPRLAQLIMTGGLDAYLGMPRNVLLHVCISSTEPNAWGDVLFSIGAYILFVRPDPLNLLLFLLLGCIVALIFAAFLIIFGSLAFFLGNTDGLVQQMLAALITFSTYPMNIFSGAVRLLLFTIIPAGFISFVPLQLLHRFTWTLAGIMLGFVLLIVLSAVGFFQLGLKRYESGNLMG
ncbi:MAG TPA: ABC-2 family transporter protein, partial [Ktedonobacterales bacterium]|nr:ABC-2 family transporter protein [Ktedonobacterales bacterium]